MEPEKQAIIQMDDSKKAIAEARALMDKMAALRGRLHISDGTGQRYLQKLKPEASLLKQAEKEIMNQYAGDTGTSSKSSSKKSKLLRNMAKRNTI